MRTFAGVPAATAAALLVFGAPRPVVAIQTAAATDARSSALVTEFLGRVDAYRKLRDTIEAKTGPVPKSAQPAAITARQHAIGEAIRQARTAAKQGDLFTSDVADLFRRLIAGDLERRDPVERQAFLVSQPNVVLHVNDFYPSTVPLATVPPRLLAELPRLPQGLQYRFVGTSLILFDVDPNLVVDVLPRALPDRKR